jgi:hypothetical protein
MTPKEKAQEIFDKYYIVCQEYTEEIQCSIQAKQCTLIAVDEILQNFGTLTEGKQHYAAYYTIKYYEEVKHEIENL